MVYSAILFILIRLCSALKLKLQKKKKKGFPGEQNMLFVKTFGLNFRGYVK